MTLTRYTKKNFPFFIINHGRWDLYANESGYCVAIPTDEGMKGGAIATHFGDAEYVKNALDVDVMSILLHKHFSAASKTSKPEMQLETKISARFITAMPPASAVEQASLDALNHHAEEICETLQPIFQRLIIEMLELKRQTHATGGNHNAGSQQADIPSND